MKKYKLAIHGMHCASCGTNIERALKKVHGVKDVSVSVMVGKGFVEAEKEINADDMKKAVSKAGSYKIDSIEEV